MFPVGRSATKTSRASLVSPGTSRDENDSKATELPSALMAGPKLGLSVGRPPPPTLTRRVAPATRSWTNTSPVALASSGTRLSASDSKATSRPSPLIDGAPLGPSPGVPWGPTLASTVVWATRSRTKTSSSPLPSPGVRFDAADVKAT